MSGVEEPRAMPPPAQIKMLLNPFMSNLKSQQIRRELARIQNSASRFRHLLMMCVRGNRKKGENRSVPLWSPPLLHRGSVTVLEVEFRLVSFFGCVPPAQGTDTTHINTRPHAPVNPAPNKPLT
ncbi:hypothetical protein WMY93_029287 [Mugilogobius chulae]|uniref:Uncharacterized protein n=1 Tax=Mugilogobius chulae TaxID=88201 RepID=A0AAW0N311_9GOBI